MKVSLTAYHNFFYIILGHNLGTMEKLKAQPNDNYKCGYCNFTTKFKQNLSKHVATHRLSGKKPLLHSCDKCAFETKDKSSFKRHQLTHKLIQIVIIISYWQMGEILGNWRRWNTINVHSATL